MSDELGRRLSELAAAGEQAGLPAAPDAVRGRARRRQVRRRALSGGALTALVIGAAVAVASGSGGGGGGGQHVKVGGSTTVVTPTTLAGLPTPTTVVPVPTTVPPIGPLTILPPDGPVVADHSKLSALSFVSPSLGYALTGEHPVGGLVQLARTQDGGATWHLVGPAVPFARTTPSDFVPVSRLTLNGDDIYAFAPGLFVSHNSGATWNPANTQVHNVQDLEIGGSRVWAVGTCDPTSQTCPESVVTSDDRGATWLNSPAPPAVSGFAATISPLDAQQAYVSSFGSGATADLRLTTDGGHSWQRPGDPCQTGDVVFQQLAAVTPTNLWLACAGSPATIQQGKQVYRSADEGRHWSLVASVGYGTDTGSITLSGHANRLVALSDTKAWLALDRIGILATTDGGRTWHEAFAVQSDSGPVEVTALSGTSDAWAVAGQAVWRTTDGVTWTKL